MALTHKDLEKLQSNYSDWRMELVDGEIIIVSPSGYESEEVGSRLLTFMNSWVIPRKVGRVTGSKAGFILPNSDTRAPDVSFVQAQRLRRSPRSFAELAPDLIVEVKSPSDHIEKLEAKIESFLALGTRVGILINPENRTVRVYRSNQAVQTLVDGDTLTVSDLLPGWQVSVADLWAPEFD